MAEIEEMKIENENTKTEEMRIDNRVMLTKVYVGGGDDFIVISGNDISIFDRFRAAGDELETLAGEIEKKESENVEGEKDFKKEIEERKHFSERASAIMDDVFGEGTTRKFFGDVYAEIPDFCPDLECFMDFWASLVPVIERISGHKIKLEKLAIERRLAKYVPQNYKRPQK